MKFSNYNANQSKFKVTKSNLKNMSFFRIYYPCYIQVNNLTMRNFFLKIPVKKNENWIFQILVVSSDQLLFGLGLLRNSLSKQFLQSPRLKISKIQASLGACILWHQTY